MSDRLLQPKLWIVMTAVGIALGTGLALRADEVKEAADPKPGTRSEAAPTQSPVSDAECLSRETVVQDLRRMREQLEGERRALEARSQELKAREQAVVGELKRLEDYRAEITRIEEAQGKEFEGRVAKVVETLESMNPKAGSQLLAGIEEGLAVAAASRLSTAKLAKLMNVMEPAKSARLTELMAGVARARGVSSAPALSKGGAEATKESKGGERK